MAEWAGDDHGVGALADRLAEVLRGHGEGVLLVGSERREAAALALAADVHVRAAQRLGHLLQVELPLRTLDDVYGAAEVAAVEGGEAETVQRALDLALDDVQSHVLDERPEEVLHVRRALVFEPLVGQVLAVDAGAIGRVGQPERAPADDTLAGAADGEQGEAHRLRLGERASVDGVGYLSRDESRAAAPDVLQLFHFDVELGCDPNERVVEFRAEALGNASGVEGEPVAHRCFSFRSPALSRLYRSKILLMCSAPGRL